MPPQPAVRKAPVADGGVITREETAMRYESLRTFMLFGKHYWWDRLPDGRLSLQRAAWL